VSRRTSSPSTHDRSFVERLADIGFEARSIRTVAASTAARTAMPVRVTPSWACSSRLDFETRLFYKVGPRAVRRSSGGRLRLQFIALGANRTVPANRAKNCT